VNTVSNTTLFNVLTAIPPLLGLLAVLYSVTRVVQLRRAERKLLKAENSIQGRLTSEETVQTPSLFVELRNALAHARGDTLTPQEFGKVASLIDKHLRDLERKGALDERDRARIEELLYQPSDKGRTNYIVKLLRKLDSQKVTGESQDENGSGND
jgi:hypothetical protein